MDTLSTSAMEFLKALGRRISLYLVKTENQHFFFSAFLSTFNASIVYFCKILLLTVTIWLIHEVTFHTLC